MFFSSHFSLYFKHKLPHKIYMNEEMYTHFMTDNKQAEAVPLSQRK